MRKGGKSTRNDTVKPVFGEMKRDGRKPSMSLRGLVKVQGEEKLTSVWAEVKTRLEGEQNWLKLGGNLQRINV